MVYGVDAAEESREWVHELPNGHIAFQFDQEQALVLYEWLRRWEEEDVGVRLALFEDEAEQRALSGLRAGLERVIVERSQPDYRALVERARLVLRERIA